MTLIERAEKALADWKAGHINHSLHLELAKLVEEFHSLVSKVEGKPSEPVVPVVPPKVVEAQ